MKEHLRRCLLCALTVLTITLATATPPAQAAVLNFFTRLDTANGWSFIDAGAASWCGSFSNQIICNFAIYPGFINNGIKRITIKPKSCFPSGQRTFRVIARGTINGDHELVAFINLTRSGGTWTIPTWDTPGDATAPFIRIVIENFNRLDCLDYMELKKFI